MAFTITPSLVPGLNKKGPFYYDTNSGKQSPALGTTVKGSDGHDYTLIKAGGTFAANADIGITETTWTTATGTTHKVPADLTGGVVVNDIFWARKATL